MKYKNRKHAKRKYKHALLATVATMTLGVSTLGSTSSAFAAENSTDSQTHPKLTDAMAQATATQTSKKAKEKSFVKDYVIKYNSKTTHKIVANSMADILRAAGSESGLSSLDLNNFFRSMILTGADYMPFGMYVSPLIGLIWGENKANPLDKLKKQLEKYVINEIDNEQLNYLQGEFKALTNDLKTLENAVNEKDS
ncbi:hypothetical protein C5137_29330 [Bacillus cereus]|uniref:hypothetical protein n=1 Tax=Bacillus cereus TaxID=1396 RepID=UPI001F5D1C8B|nr:hypothetical protein [Bacillus cereus]MCI3150158.1 hypothetical protein [Bacillus cereus]